MTPRLRPLALALGLAALALVATGCGDADDDTASGDATTTTAAAKEQAPVISDAWARTSPMSASNGAAYFVVTGGSEDDEITGASADPSVAGTVQIHETVMSDSSGDMSSTTAMGGSSDGMSTTTAMGDASGDMSATTMAPAMQMREVESIAVPAGETVELKPGGYHVMLIDLPKPLEQGTTFDLTVTFAKAGDQTVTVEVKDAP